MAQRDRRRMKPSPLHLNSAETAQLDNALQQDISMFGLSYLQIIFDLIEKNPTTGKPAGLHFEPGIWATVPANAAS
jgi:hypothetical protein